MQPTCLYREVSCWLEREEGRLCRLWRGHEDGHIGVEAHAHGRQHGGAVHGDPVLHAHGAALRPGHTQAPGLAEFGSVCHRRCGARSGALLPSRTRDKPQGHTPKNAMTPTTPAAPHIPQIRLYQDWLAAERGLRFDSYDALWRWSTTELDAFWQSIWDYFELHSPTPHAAVLELVSRGESELRAAGVSPC
jgi:hypothetical protein